MEDIRNKLLLLVTLLAFLVVSAIISVAAVLYPIATKELTTQGQIWVQSHHRPARVVSFEEDGRVTTKFAGEVASEHASENSDRETAFYKAASELDRLESAAQTMVDLTLRAGLAHQGSPQMPFSASHLGTPIDFQANPLTVKALLIGGLNISVSGLGRPTAREAALAATVFLEAQCVRLAIQHAERCPAGEDGGLRTELLKAGVDCRRLASVSALGATTADWHRAFKAVRAWMANSRSRTRATLVYDGGG